MPNVRNGERPTAYADNVGEWYVAQRSSRQRKDYGLYLTPIAAADFMARQLVAKPAKMRVLDPAAGSGILCCAAVEAIAAQPRRPSVIELVAYEVDPGLVAPLRAVLAYLADWCRVRHNLTLDIRVEATDFVMANARALRPRSFFDSTDVDVFDVVISNPPYYKVSRDDPRAKAAAEVVHGQPNIYALFMAVGAAMLCEGGEFVFITPRSFASGPYFRRFRTVFFDMIRPTDVHVFGSRRDPFRRDAVLQENVIVSGVRQDEWHKTHTPVSLGITSSVGVEDIEARNTRSVTADTVLQVGSVDRVLRLPVCDEDEQALAIVDSWPSSLAGLGMNISTGPVVPFRATELVVETGAIPSEHVPLLWMNHVRAMRTTWPLGRHKPEYIARSGAETLLVPNRNYVLIRRFSAKEEARRLTAAPYIAGDFEIPEVGFENHLNYIHRPGGTLSKDEAWGLAALYNSSLLDTWFRAVNGNTQVSATELRAMRLPLCETIVDLGRRIRCLADPLAGLDALVTDMLASPVSLEIGDG